MLHFEVGDIACDHGSLHVRVYRKTSDKEQNMTLSRKIAKYDFIEENVQI
jgi:hypothetical protein